MPLLFKPKTKATPHTQHRRAVSALCSDVVRPSSLLFCRIQVFYRIKDTQLKDHTHTHIWKTVGVLAVVVSFVRYEVILRDLLYGWEESRRFIGQDAESVLCGYSRLVFWILIRFCVCYLGTYLSAQSRLYLAICEDDID